MDNEPAQSGKPGEGQELTELLRTLRVEATPEAYFEERFLQDFRRRVEREMACRSICSLLLEHMAILMEHVGVRRVAFSASAFGLGALCVGVLAWQSDPPAAVAEHLCELESRANSLQPGISRQVVSTTVRSGRVRRTTHKRNIVVLADGDEDPLYAGGGLEDTTLQEVNAAPWADDAGMLLTP